MLEKILEVLATLIAALNANTAALKGAATEETKKGKTKDKTVETPTGAPAPGVAEVRAAATAFLDAQKNEELQKKFMSELNGKYGTKRISEAPADKFPEVIAILNAEVARLKTASSAPAPSAADAV